MKEMRDKKIQSAEPISVIICAYTEDRWATLVAAVASVQQQTLPPDEIIVVIDHNTSLLEQVRASIPGVIAIGNSGPRGLSGARNSGVAIAQGALVAFLDDDAMAEPDWLMQLSRHCQNPRVLGVGGAVEPLWLIKRPAWFPEEFYWVVGCTYRGQPQALAVVRNTFGGNTCIRREIFALVGGFRDGVGREGGVPMGCEETELCIRAKQHWPQKVFLYEPQARIHHCIPPDRACWRYFRSRCYAEGLSKAGVTRHVGAKDGLASERAYALWTLPRGIARGLADALLHHDPAGLARAGAIVAGLVITATGYLVGNLILQGKRLKYRIAGEEVLLHNTEMPAAVKVEPQGSMETQKRP
jgi:glucosyl-dolichyl phosphate glucuronosyltransferase